MKTKAEKYAEGYRCPATNKNEYCKHDIISAYNNGYTQCQEDMAKKYTEEDVIRLMFNATKWDTFKEGEVGYNMTLSQYFNYCLHSLNKQD